MKIQTSKELQTGKVTLIMTPEQQDVYDFGREVREKITQKLADDYINSFGDKILDTITPEIIAGDIKKYVSNRFWAKEL